MFGDTLTNNAEQNEANLMTDLTEAEINSALSLAYDQLSEKDKAEIDVQIAALIRGVRARHNAIRSQLEKEVGPESSRFIGKPSIQFGPAQALQVLAALGMFYVSTPLQIYTLGGKSVTATS